MAKATETSKLTTFLLALQTSQSAQQRFKKDAEGEMERFDLSSATIEAVMVQNSKHLWKVLTRVPVQVGHAVVGKKKPPRKSKRK